MASSTTTLPGSKTRGETHAPDRFRHWVQNDYCPGPYRAQLSFSGFVERPVNRGFTVTGAGGEHIHRTVALMPSGAGGIQLRYGITTMAGASVYREQVGRFTRTVRRVNPSTSTCGIPPLASGTYLFFADLLDAEPIDLLNTRSCSTAPNRWRRFCRWGEVSGSGDKNQDSEKKRLALDDS